MPYPSNAQASASTTARNRSEKVTMARSMISDFFRCPDQLRSFSGLSFEFFGQQLLRADSDYLVAFFETSNDIPTALDRMFSAGLFARELGGGGLKENPGSALRPYHRSAWHHNSFFRILASNDERRHGHSGNQFFAVV